MEALGHVFLYFLRGSLPWQGLKAATNKQKYERIGEKKQQTSIRELCDGHPEEFVQYLTYSRKLGFEETPDYDYLRSLMNKVLMSYDEGDDGVYDWMLVDKEKLRKVRLVCYLLKTDLSRSPSSLNTATPISATAMP